MASHMDVSLNTIGNAAGALPTRDLEGRNRKCPLPAAIFAVTFIAYLPSLGGQLIWNDDRCVTKSSLQSLQGPWRIWTEPGAIQGLQKAVTLNPNYVEAQNDLGISLADSGQVAEAVTCFRAVARL